MIRARESGLFELVVVDSDDHAILQAALDAGADLTLERPAELATSEAAKIPVIARAARVAEETSGLQFDTFVDLDATSPLRSVGDIVGVVDLLETTDAENVISVSPAHRSPYFNLVERRTDGFIELSKSSEIVRRQDSPDCFDINGSVYAWKRAPFIEEPFLFGDRTACYVMPRERSFDIDEPLDLEIVTMLFERSEARSAEASA